MSRQAKHQSQVRVFSTTSCFYCRLLINYLDEKEIDFEEIMVDQDHGGLHEFIQVSNGYSGVPFTVISKSDGELIKIRGFDKDKVNEALDLKN
jgi:glutaredoxin